MDNIEQIGIEARKYEVLQNLTSHEGWSILKEFVEKRKQTIVLDMLVEKEHIKLIALQEEYKAFCSVINTIESANDIKEKLYKDIQDIVEDDKLKKEFDI